MKRIAILLLLAALLVSLLAACGQPAPPPEDDAAITVAAATYPIALLADAVAEGADNITVTAVVNQEISCVHDYTLTTRDMQTVEAADILLLNGAGLDVFLDDVLAAYPGTVVDCSAGIPLLTMEDGEPDPHIWMDPARAGQMAQNIAKALAEADPDHAELYRKNATDVMAQLYALRDELYDRVSGSGADGYCHQLITFHDGFAYFADSFDLILLCSIEEEPGSEASAQDIAEIIDLIRTEQVPLIFIETNSSHATADAIARETGAAVRELTLIMNGDINAGLSSYEDAMRANIEALRLPGGDA